MSRGVLLVFLALVALSQLNAEFVETEFNFNFNKVLPATDDCAAVKRAPPKGKTVVSVAALSDLTSKKLCVGKEVAVAYQAAIDDLNKLAHSTGLDVEFHLEVYDTEGDGKLAQEKFELAYSHGARIFLGPLTSEEILELKPLADKKDAFFFSPSSTAITLRYNDTFFRYAKADDELSLGMNNILFRMDKRTLLPVWRTDSYGQSVMMKLQNLFIQGEGKVRGGYGYLKEVNPDRIAASLSEIIEKDGSVATAAVALASYDEWQDILASARKHENLKRVPWLLSESAATVSDPGAGARAFAQDALVLALSPRIPNGHWKTRVANTLKKTNIVSPSVYAYTAYDAAFAAASSYIHSRTLSAPHFNRTIEFTSSSLSLSSGRLELDTYGDRFAVGELEYDILRLDAQAGWVSYGTYDADHGAYFLSH